MHLVVGSLKGGVGKSTSAVHLALGLAREGRTLLIDADPQGSALGWSELASADTGQDFPAVIVSLPTRDLARRVAQLQRDYRHIVIDTGPGHPEILRSALRAADVLVVTMAPTLVEVHRLGPTFELADEITDLG